MLDKASVYVLAEGMFFIWTQKPIRFQLFGLSTAFLKFFKFFMMFLKPRVSFCINFAPFCNILAKTQVKV